MTYYDNATGEILQVFLQHLECLDIKVVGRLIENQKVRIPHQHRTEIELALLASTQLIYVVVLFLWSKEEELQELRSRHVLAISQVDIIGNLGNDINHLLVFLEFQSLLREIAEANRLTDVKLTAVRLNFTQEHLDEGRLTRSVITHDTHLLESGKVVIEVIKYHLLLTTVIESLANILAFKYLGTDVYGRCFQTHLSVFDTLLSHLLQFIESIFTILSLMTTCLRLAAHPVKLPAVEILGMLNFCSEIIHALLTFLQIVGIIASIGIDGLIVKFQDGIAHLVQEETVVSNHEDGLVSSVQVSLQPFYHFQVKVVGRLIEHQEIGLLYQHISQGNTFLLSSTKLSHRLLHIGNM